VSYVVVVVAEGSRRRGGSRCRPGSRTGVRCRPGLCRNDEPYSVADIFGPYRLFQCAEDQFGVHSGASMSTRSDRRTGHARPRAAHALASRNPSPVSHPNPDLFGGGAQARRFPARGPGSRRDCGHRAARGLPDLLPARGLLSGGWAPGRSGVGRRAGTALGFVRSCAPDPAAAGSVPASAGEGATLGGERLILPM
jgi:hypothetical protein